EFAGWTGDGNVRQGAYKGLREDKAFQEITMEEAEPVAEVEEKVTRARAKVSRSSSSPTSRAKGRGYAKDRAKRSSNAKSSGAGKRSTCGEGARATQANRAQAKPAVVANARAAHAAASNGSPAVMGVTISHPDKVMWPDAGDGEPVTKLDLAKYYESVGEWVIPHLKGRPCSIVRAPDGLGGQVFFQRHAMPGTSELLELVRVSGDHEAYLQIDRVEGLIAVAQIAALELHPWNCQPDKPEVPGRLVFDLDPGPEVEFSAVIDAARELRERLEKLGLVTFCKTTGGKGLHVVTPLSKDAKGREANWDVGKAFAQTVCTQMANDSPNLYVINMAKNVRKGRIFLDYLRNDRIATAVAPLSTRARPGAAVSMPLNWTSVRAGLDPKAFTLRT